MALRKDKKQVIGEEMTDEQIHRLLAGEPPAGTDRDFHCLERAYRSLRADDFVRFLAFFMAEGRNPGARDSHGRTLAEIMAKHTSSADYRSALRTVGG